MLRLNNGLEHTADSYFSHLVIDYGFTIPSTVKIICSNVFGGSIMRGATFENRYLLI